MGNTIKHLSARNCVVQILKFALLIGWALTCIIPLLWVFMNSFKSSGEILRSSMSVPSSLEFVNYKTLIGYPDVNLIKAFFNSIIISGSTVVLVIAIASMASFALGRFKLMIASVILACLLVPAFATVIPNFVTMSKIPFVKGSYLAAIIPQTAGNLCFSIIMMTGFMKSLPEELDEAALIDGAGVWTIFSKISVPLCRSMISTIAIMVFIWSYNDLFTSLVYISRQSMKPVCVILSMVSNMFGTDYGAMMAAITITIIPPLVLYAIAQEQVVSGLTAGAVKG